MKQLLLALLVFSLSLCLDPAAYAQGTLVFNNLGPNDGKVFLFDWANTQTLLNQDLNFSLRAGGVTRGASRLRAYLAFERRHRERDQRRTGPVRRSQPQRACALRVCPWSNGRCVRKRLGRELFHVR